MDRMMTVGMPGQVGRLRPAQIAQQSTWDGVPQPQRTEAAMHTIHVVPAGSSTVTYVNPMDPMTTAGEFKKAPHAPGTLMKAWRI